MGAPVVVEHLNPRRLPIIFGPRDRPLTGFYHPPVGALARSQSVLLCNPIGYESMSVHRTYRHLAERLAEAGFASLRFDYDGTGDSPARSDAPGRVAAWVESIRTAVAELRDRSQTERVTLFGVGLGATLAALAGSELPELEGLVLWAPIVSGRAHARALRAFRLFKYSKAGPPPRTDGGEEIAGYLFSSETLRDLAAIDLLQLRTAARRSLVVAGSDNPSAETLLVDHLRAGGSEARLAPDLGYARMMRDDPYESIVPVAALDAIVTWLSEGDPLERRAPIAVPSGAGNVTTIAGKGRSALRESPIAFAGGRLFGILTEPAADSARAEGPAVVFLNVGANSHVGPHRMNVELAREVAALGYPAFRFDVSGLGESAVAPGTPENRIYTREAVADVQAAMNVVAERGSKRFVLVGLCSGAYLAFHTAVEDQRVVGEVLLSPYAFEWSEGDPVTPSERKGVQAFRSTRFYARAALDPRAWRLVLQGEVDVAGIMGAVLERAGTQIETALPLLSARLRRSVPPQSSIERSFRDLCDRGVETLMVLGFEDGGLDMIARYLGRDARRLRGRRNFVLRILPSIDHTFTTIDSQGQLREALTGYLASRFS